MTPFRDRTLELLDDPAELDRILADGAERAREVGRGHPGARVRPGRFPAPRLGARWSTVPTIGVSIAIPPPLRR